MIVFSYEQLRRFSAELYNQDYDKFRHATFKDLDSLPIQRRNDPESQEYDVFLSHSISDLPATLGIKGVLEAHGLSVYIDWLCDMDLIPTTANRETIKRLMLRMKKSRSLVYVFSIQSRKSSVWMPWELGYFHGKKDKVALVGVGRNAKPDHDLRGNEFLLIYPYLMSQHGEFYVGEVEHRFASLTEWVRKGEKELHRQAITDPEMPVEIIEKAEKEISKWV